jgi:hypothetical protein
MLALLERAEVQEVEHDRLFDLVGEVACQDDPGNMCLDEFDVLGAMFKRLRAQQPGDQPGIEWCDCGFGPVHGSHPVGGASRGYRAALIISGPRS